jgi:hypothetical protein
MKGLGHADLVFYADHPALLATFRKRRCKEEGCLEGVRQYLFYHWLKT